MNVPASSRFTSSGHFSFSALADRARTLKLFVFLAVRCAHYLPLAPHAAIGRGKGGGIVGGGKRTTPSHLELAAATSC
eukprot:3026085-Pleurochrysis_carterae.AAC.1